MRRILFLIVSFGVQLSTAASDTTTNGGDKIGENITVVARVFYDSSYDEKLKGKTDSEERKSSSSKPPKEYFEKLFQTVQTRFNERNVSIKIDVGNVTKINNLSAPYEQSELSLNGSQTLDNLKNYSTYLGAPNNAVYFLYTTKNIYKKIDRGDRMPLDLQDMATYGTFCTDNVSAAVVKDRPVRWIYWNTVEALANIFGVKHYSRFRKSDLKTMNETFRRCQASEQTGALSLSTK
uniref:Putative secreted protein n=1 Tax=Amblyomma cajennense TaxID=34607 RepID=A0A023FFM7_AMBCJ